MGIGESHTPIIADTVSTISIFDMFAFVKELDAECHSNTVISLFCVDTMEPSPAEKVAE